jgi:hypothetical protein
MRFIIYTSDRVIMFKKKMLTNEQLQDAKKYENERIIKKSEIITILFINLHVYEEFNCLMSD